METHDFTAAKVGDKVSHLMFGNGVIKINDHLNTPIQVEFDHGKFGWFYSDGKYTKFDVLPTLYHGHNTFKIIATPVSPYKEGEWIAVSDDNKTWFVRQFVKMRQDSLTVAKSSDSDDGDILWKYSKSLTELNAELNNK